MAVPMWKIIIDELYRNKFVPNNTFQDWLNLVSQSMNRDDLQQIFLGTLIGDEDEEDNSVVDIVSLKRINWLASLNTKQNWNRLKSSFLYWSELACILTHRLQIEVHLVQRDNYFDETVTSCFSTPQTTKENYLWIGVPFRDCRVVQCNK